MNWDFKHRPDRVYQYEAYYSPQGPEMAELYKWCWDTFGHPGQPLDEFGNGSWESHGGWIKFRGEQELTMFLMRWG